MKKSNKHSLSLPKLAPCPNEVLKKEAILCLYTSTNALPKTTTTSWTTPLSPRVKKDPLKVLPLYNPGLFKTVRNIRNYPKEQTADTKTKRKYFPRAETKQNCNNNNEVKSIIKKQLPAKWNLDWLLRSDLENKAQTTKNERSPGHRIKRQKFIDRNTAFRNVTSFNLMDKFTQLDQQLTELNAHAKSELHRIYNKFYPH